MEDEISIFQQEHSEIQSLPLTDFRHIFLNKKIYPMIIIIRDYNYQQVEL